MARKVLERKTFNSLEDEYNYLYKRMETLADKNRVSVELSGNLHGHPTELINIHGFQCESWMLINYKDGTVAIKKPGEDVWKLYASSSKTVKFLEDWIIDYDLKVRPKLASASNIHEVLKPHVPSDIKLDVSYEGRVILTFHDLSVVFDHTDIDSDVELINIYTESLRKEFRTYEMARAAENALHEKVKDILVANGINFEVSCLEDCTIYATDANGTKVNVTDLF